MKNSIFISLLAVTLFVSAQVHAQEFKPFRVDAGLGYAIPFTKGFDAGLMFYLEPKYEIAPQIAVGLRWEPALFGGGINDVEGASVNLKMSSSYMLTGDYYLNNNKFRPFAGLGLGAYSMGGVSVKTGDELGNLNQSIDGSTNFAALLRAGFDVSHFRFTLSYEHVFASETFNYLALSVGFYIGGGKN